MSSKIISISSSRSDLGLLSILVRRILKKKQNIDLLICGSHLDKNFGKTEKDINREIKKISLKLYTDTNFKKPNFKKKILNKFNLVLKKKHYDYGIILGDRFESYLFSLALKKRKIPIFHISGGDTSLGSKDNIYRDKISKLAYLHFVKTKNQKRKLFKLGVNQKKIFIVGSLAVELLKKKIPKLNKKEKKIIKQKKPFCLASFHPSTNSKNTNDNNLQPLLDSTKKFKNLIFIFTAPSHDGNGKSLVIKMKNFCKKNVNCFFNYNFGSEKYFYFLKKSKFVIGNSSSGIIESSLLKKYSINILPRQKGREHDKNVFHCKNYKKDISLKINEILKRKSINFTSIFDRRKQIGLPSNFIIKKILSVK